MALDRRLLMAIGVIALSTIVWLLLTIGLIASALDAPQRALLAEQLMPRMALIVLMWALGLVVIASTLRWLFRRYAKAPAKLVEQTRVLLAAEQAAPLCHVGTKETTELADVIFSLACQRDQLRSDVDKQVAAASQAIQQERDRLAALMAELTQSVVVCNLDGRILLYNNRARMQFKTLSDTPVLAGGAELLGIGRSIYVALDRQLVTHAMDSIQRRLMRGAAHPTAQFVKSTKTGQMLRVLMAPVRTSRTDDANNILNGFVLMLDNVTRAYKDENARGQKILAVTQACAAALEAMRGSLTAAESMLQNQQETSQLIASLRGDVLTVSERLSDLDRQVKQDLKMLWPMEEMLGADVLLVAQQRIQQYCKRDVVIDRDVAAVWLRIDSHSLIQSLVYLAARLVEELGVKFLQLRLTCVDGIAQLDLVWTGQIMSTETAMTWEMDDINLGAENSTLSVRDVVERHGADFVFARERIRQEAFFRLKLRPVSVQEQAELIPTPQDQSRPEYYDFDLFQSTAHSDVLEDRLLSELSYTVFDTETTGLRPSEGDQIIQIGATRIVNGKLMRQECIDQLVNPKRMIPAATIPIHGITQDMVAGKPSIHEVLPTFYTFAQDTVLVAHNAAFDMRFLQLLEKDTGLVFDHPVLDTLLLSAVVHPNQDSHRLEAIADRFNITVLGRHTAFGDALVTAEVWLRLLPLLQAQGIRTLRQAREAAKKTYYARLKY